MYYTFLQFSGGLQKETVFNFAAELFKKTKKETRSSELFELKNCVEPHQKSVEIVDAFYNYDDETSSFFFNENKNENEFFGDEDSDNNNNSDNENEDENDNDKNKFNYLMSKAQDKFRRDDIDSLGDRTENENENKVENEDGEKREIEKKRTKIGNNSAETENQREFMNCNSNNFSYEVSDNNYFENSAGNNNSNFFLSRQFFQKIMPHAVESEMMMAELGMRF